MKLCRSARRRAPRSGPGFTLIEMLVVLAILGLVLTIGLPALQELIHRSKLEGTARQASVMMQAARFEAIKRGRDVVVLADTATNLLVSFVDADRDRVQDDGEVELGRITLPSAVSFTAPGGQQAIDGLPTNGTTGWAVFNSDGSTEVGGAFRIADARDNFLEVRIMLPSTARLEMRKWIDGAWLAPREGGRSWKWY